MWQANGRGLKNDLDWRSFRNRAFLIEVTEDVFNLSLCGTTQSLSVCFYVTGLRILEVVFSLSLCSVCLWLQRHQGHVQRFWERDQTGNLKPIAALSQNKCISVCVSVHCSCIAGVLTVDLTRSSYFLICSSNLWSSLWVYFLLPVETSCLQHGELWWRTQWVTDLPLTAASEMHFKWSRMQSYIFFRNFEHLIRSWNNFFFKNQMDRFIRGQEPIVSVCFLI